jgi:hypothetical protein
MASHCRIDLATLTTSGGREVRWDVGCAGPENEPCWLAVVYRERNQLLPKYYYIFFVVDGIECGRGTASKKVLAQEIAAQQALDVLRQ